MADRRARADLSSFGQDAEAPDAGIENDPIDRAFFDELSALIGGPNWEEMLACQRGEVAASFVLGPVTLKN